MSQHISQLIIHISCRPSWRAPRECVSYIIGSRLDAIMCFKQGFPHFSSKHKEHKHKLSTCKNKEHNRHEFIATHMNEEAVCKVMAFYSQLTKRIPLRHN